MSREKRPNADNSDTKIHCVCFVFDASTFDVLEASTVSTFRQYMTILKDKNLRCGFILTHIDKVCREIEWNGVEKVYHSRRVYQVIKNVAWTFGVTTHNVFPMKNYESETEPELQMDILSLYTVTRILEICAKYGQQLPDFTSKMGTFGKIFDLLLLQEKEDILNKDH